LIVIATSLLVIASVARQSMAPNFLDCHVAALLAMTMEKYFGNYKLP